MDPDTGSWANWVIGLIVVVAIVALLLLARGPTNQDRSVDARPMAVVALVA
jgi:hypothetical protein